MSHLKNINDPILFLYKKFCSLEFKQKETILSLIRNYYPLNKDEEVYIKDISITNKNEFMSHIKKIFHELSISMETIELIFNEYYHFINKNNNENPFYPIQKGEVINKLGISSNIYNKILTLYDNILCSVVGGKPGNSKDICNYVEDDIQMIIEDEKNIKRNIELKINNINFLCKDIESIFTTYHENKKENNEPKNDKKINGNITLTPDEQKELKSKLELYEKEIN